MKDHLLRRLTSVPDNQKDYAEYDRHLRAWDGTPRYSHLDSTLYLMPNVTEQKPFCTHVFILSLSLSPSSSLPIPLLSSSLPPLFFFEFSFWCTFLLNSDSLKAGTILGFLIYFFNLPLSKTASSPHTPFSLLTPFYIYLFFVNAMLVMVLVHVCLSPLIPAASHMPVYKVLLMFFRSYNDQYLRVGSLFNRDCIFTMKLPCDSDILQSCSYQTSGDWSWSP